MADAAAWRVAFAKQAQADLDARDFLVSSPQLSSCHQLHFLQMACEKLCKAHLCRHGSDPAEIQSSHAYIASVLPSIARQHLARTARQIPKSRSRVLGAIRKLARRIELLAPAVDAGGRHPANCEYPWETADGSIAVPAEFNFRFDLLYEEGGRHLLKILRVAVRELIQSEPTPQ